MSFRRIPFQFSSTDPAERQRELEKRFCVPSKNKMYVDNVNRLPMGSGFKDSGGYSSPRLQHRVPIFVDGYDQPNRSSVDSRSETKKPNVRVIPIEVEGAETVPSTRHRTFSGPAGFAKECTEESLPPRDDMSPLKRSMQDLTKPTKMKATTGPKVFNIPIKVEGADSVKNNSTKSPVQKVHPEVNGCDKSKRVKESKLTSKEASKPEISEEQKMEININNAMKKIENILEELKSYESGVKEFSGTVKDKQYRYLDEMLTRCMLRLDDVDTMGSEKVRSARKNAVKQVQMCIDMLEEKISSIKETEKNAENEIQCENIDQEEAKLKENGITTDDKMQISELSDHADKTEVKYVEIMDVANSETRDGRPESSTQEPSQDATLSVSEIKASDKLEDSKINVDITCKVSEVNDVEMVESIVNFESEDNKPAERSEESVTPKEGSYCNLGEIKTVEKSDDSKVTMSSEVEMKEGILEDNNSEIMIEVEMPECPKVSHSEVEVPSVNPELTVEDSVSQESEVEMKEVETTLNELKDKAIIADNIELQTIPNKGTEISVTDTSVSGLCETQTDYQSASSHKKPNITET